MSPPWQLTGSSLLSFLNIANMEAKAIQSQEQMDPNSQVNPDAFEPQGTCSFPPSCYSRRGWRTDWVNDWPKLTCVVAKPSSCVVQARVPAHPAPWLHKTESQVSASMLHKADWPHDGFAFGSAVLVRCFSSSMVYYLSMVFLSLRHSWSNWKWCQLGKQALSLLVLSFLKYLLVSGNLNWVRPSGLESQTRTFWLVPELFEGRNHFLFMFGAPMPRYRLAYSKTAKWEVVKKKKKKLCRVWNRSQKELWLNPWQEASTGAWLWGPQHSHPQNNTDTSHPTEMLCGQNEMGHQVQETPCQSQPPINVEARKGWSRLAFQTGPFLGDKQGTKKRWQRMQLPSLWAVRLSFAIYCQSSEPCLKASPASSRLLLHLPVKS